MKEDQIYLGDNSKSNERYMLMQKRGFKVGVFLVASIMACMLIFFMTGLDTSTKIMSAGLGTILGIFTCGYMQLFRNRQTSNIGNDIDDRTTRWMIPSVLVGIVLARIVIGRLEPEIQGLVNNLIFAWSTVFFAYLAIWFWRYTE